MRMKSLLVCLFALVSVSASAEANPSHPADAPNILDEIDPFDPTIEEQLNAFDEEYERETGLSSRLEDDRLPFFKNRCYRQTCMVWARVIRSEQTMYLYVNGNPAGSWLVSTGKSGHRTPRFDRHPNGRIYDRYNSKTWPGGDYNGLGNMPYAVFIEGGFALHGTDESNWKKLGKPASHGCIRMHPDDAYRFNRLVRKHGKYNTWITVE